MKKITLYYKGEQVAQYNEVNGLLLQKDGVLQILNGTDWIWLEKGKEFDWFTVL